MPFLAPAHSFILSLSPIRLSLIIASSACIYFLSSLVFLWFRSVLRLELSVLDNAFVSFTSPASPSGAFILLCISTAHPVSCHFSFPVSLLPGPLISCRIPISFIPGKSLFLVSSVIFLSVPLPRTHLLHHIGHACSFLLW